MFNLNLIQQRLISARLPVGVQLFDRIDSTNEYLLTHCQQFDYHHVVIAKEQTAGRGRRQRPWHSPSLQNLYFSYLAQCPLTCLSKPYFSALGLFVAVALAQTLEQLGAQQIQLKWPNDLYFESRKMGGVLIETKTDAHRLHVVIGIGLNLFMQQANSSQINQPWASLQQTLASFDVNILIGYLIEKLYHLLDDVIQGNVAPWLNCWKRYDFLYQQLVTLYFKTEQLQGVAQGINEKGELILQQGDTTRYVSIGEVSLRKQVP